ncbi:MAG: creatininase family protein [Lentisphaeria bacterium]|jgi:creatinine amidohydrolase/Fe(II)-dependent formamide hydrolase-like protein
MRYELMRPKHIREAIEKRWPVILPLGVLEYHGEHLPVGMDTLAVVRCAELLEQEMDLVLLPPFYYGSASFAVEPPEGRGTVHVKSQVLLPFARELFLGLLRVGFRNIHAFIHHQSENFASGMPTDLAFRLASKQVILEFLDKTRGEGWWGDNSMANYYTEHDSLDANPFNWIQTHPLMDSDIISKYPFDHAAEGETSLMMALCPDTVDMNDYSAEKWYLESAAKASRELGEKGVAMILERMRKILKN